MNPDHLPQERIAADNRFSADVVRIVEQVFGSAGGEVLEALARTCENILRTLQYTQILSQ